MTWWIGLLTCWLLETAVISWVSVEVGMTPWAALLFGVTAGYAVLTTYARLTA